MLLPCPVLLVLLGGNLRLGSSFLRCSQEPSALADAPCPPHIDTPLWSFSSLCHMPWVVLGQFHGIHPPKVLAHDKLDQEGDNS